MLILPPARNSIQVDPVLTCGTVFDPGTRDGARRAYRRDLNSGLIENRPTSSRMGRERRFERIPVRLPTTKRDPRHLDLAGPETRGEATRLRPVPTARDSGFELSTRLHCTHVIVPLPRGPPDDEPSRERGEQPVRPRQVDLERHFEPNALP